jgi:Mrp family chromosome partitioning ATPase/capsular polysaccharide biosynthesis protein
MSSPRPVSARRSELGRIERPPADWVAEAPPRTELPIYLAALRSRIWLIVVIVVTSVVVTALLVESKPKTYKAEADLLVSPLDPGNTANADLSGLPLLFKSGDPTRDSETAAQLVTVPSVAVRVRRSLEVKASARALLGQVSAQPVAQSGIIAVTAHAHSPELAAALANGFGQGVIDDRTEQLHIALGRRIQQLQRQLAGLPPGNAAAGELAARIQSLVSLRSARDPTLALPVRALPPTHASSPHVVISVAAAFIGALILGIGGVLGLHLLDGRILLEEELRRYRIPVLARIPVDPGRKWFRGSSSPLLPGELDAVTADAFHRLASSLAAGADGSRKRIFVTGPAPSMGKTTTAINLAAALAQLDEWVTLVEVDSRRPEFTRVLALPPSSGLAGVVSAGTPVGEALQESERLPSNLHVLPQGSADASVPPFITGEAAETLVHGLDPTADRIVFDGPALNYAPEPLPIAKSADTLLVVIRLGKTRQRDLSEFAELLVQHDITPSGFIILGGTPQPTYG